MKRLLIPILGVLFITGCATGPRTYSGSVYNGNQAQQSQQVTSGKIINIRQITIQDKPNITGTSVGSAMGALGLLGFAGTGGNVYGMAAGVIAAAVVGGTVSDYVSRKILEQQGYEFTIKMDSGKAITVVQTNIDTMTTGDVVYITQSNNGTLRVYKTQ